jgi:hypothetical protein
VGAVERSMTWVLHTLALPGGRARWGATKDDLVLHTFVVLGWREDLTRPEKEVGVVERDMTWFCIDS